MGSVPCDCDVLVLSWENRGCKSCDEVTHLHVLLSGLLPLLCHGAWSNGAGEHARKREDGESTEDDGSGEEEDVAALIRRWGSAGTVGTESDVVGYR
jgi:hypothetical protein